MKILNDIAKLDAEIQKILESVEPLKQAKQKLIDKLAKLCVHAETFDDGYEVSDGYGLDKWRPHIKCSVCGISMKKK